MKKGIIMTACLLALGLGTPAVVQASVSPAPQVQADSASQQDALEAFSDTTTADAPDSTLVSVSPSQSGVSLDDVLSDDDFWDKLFAGDDGQHIPLAEMLFVIVVLFIIFVMSPLVILALLFWFIIKNRRQKMQLAQMAVQNGQPIPSELISDAKDADKDSYTSGMRQLFLGLGLMFFLGYTVGKIGFGIGVLIFFIGLGKVVIAKTTRTNENNNPTDLQNYD